MPTFSATNACNLALNTVVSNCSAWVRMKAGLDDKGRALTAQYERLMAVRETVLKSLEIARADKFIKASLEAKVSKPARRSRTRPS